MLQDLRFAVRLFSRQPGFFATAVLTIALGVGLSATVFAVVDGVLFRPLAYRESSRLVALFGAIRAEKQSTIPVSAADLADWRAASRSFEQIEAYQLGGLAARVRAADESVLVPCIPVTPGFLDMLGVRAAIGRTFAAGDAAPGAPRVAMITYTLWQRAFGGEPDVLGRTIRRGEDQFTVVGVLPRAFVFPDPRQRFAPDVLVLMTPAATSLDRGAWSLSLIGRLSAATGLEQARAEMDAIALRLKPFYAGGSPLGGFDGATLIPLRENLTRHSRGVLWLVFAAVAAVFLISCVNLVGLLLAHGEDRRRELSVRTAVGAGRSILMRQLLIEAGVLAVAGTAIGWLMSAAAFGVLVRQIPAWMQLMGQPRMDARAAVFAGLLALLTLAIAGILPALRASKQEPQAALARGTRNASGGRRGRHTLLLVQVALATLLFSAGSIMLRSWLRLYGESSGIDAKTVIAVRSVPSGLNDADRRSQYNTTVADAIRRVPGVESVAFADLPLLQKAMKGSSFVPPAEVKDAAGFETDLTVTPGYFSTMGIPLRQGRDLRPEDRGTAVVISEGLARRYWPKQNPVGESVRYGNGRREIVGVVGDARDYAFDRAPIPTLYHVWDGQRASIATMLVRFSGRSSSVIPEIRRAIRGADDAAAITMLSTVEDLLSASVAERNFNTLLFGVFAVAGVLVAVTGIYGLVAFVVARREREMGIRLALGADPRGLKLFVMSGTLRWVAGGLIAGIGGALLFGRYLEPFVYDVEATDSLTLGLVGLAFLTISALASYIPARRAARVDPMTALRAE